MRELALSKNCSENRSIMISLLDKIVARGGQTLLYAFLSEKFSYIVHNVDPKMDQHGVFPGFIPGLLSYPRRMIFRGAPATLESVIDKFVSDKTYHDSIILDNVAYIEYLNQNEVDLIDKIPEGNWMIKAYRNRS